MRSTPASSHRRKPSNATSLPAIDEDNASFLTDSTKVPAVPPRALNRPVGNGRYAGRGFGTGSAQGWVDEDAGSGPPSYHSDDGKIEKSDNKFVALRRGLEENRHISKRGGWRRLLLLLLLLLISLGIALGVGLGVGLKKKHGANSYVWKGQ